MLFLWEPLLFYFEEKSDTKRTGAGRVWSSRVSNENESETTLVLSLLLAIPIKPLIHTLKKVCPNVTKRR